MEDEKIVVFWGLNTSSTLTTSTPYVGKIQATYMTINLSL